MSVESPFWQIAPVGRVPRPCPDFLPVWLITLVTFRTREMAHGTNRKRKFVEHRVLISAALLGFAETQVDSEVEAGPVWCYILDHRVWIRPLVDKWHAKCGFVHDDSLTVEFRIIKPLCHIQSTICNNFLHFVIKVTPKVSVIIDLLANHKLEVCPFRVTADSLVQRGERLILLENPIEVVELILVTLLPCWNKPKQTEDGEARCLRVK